MIQFRCWYCNKCYRVPEERIGTRLVCTCGNALGVPKRSGGKCRIKTLLDWIIEITVYGGGGAVLGAGLGILILSQIGRFGIRYGSWEMLAACTLAGFLFGTLGGERGIEWIGRKIRDRENR